MLLLLLLLAPLFVAVSGAACAGGICECVGGSLVNCSLPAAPMPAVDAKTAPLCGLSPEATYKTRGLAPVCLMIGGLYPALFYPVVDEMTLLHMDLNGTQELVTRSTKRLFDNPAQWLQLEVGNVSSRAKPRQDGNKVVPYWTAIVELKNGAVRAVVWDDFCCDKCVANTCAVTTDQCRHVGGNVDCDLRVYLVWTGTDADGRFLTSAGKRESRFRKYSVYGAYNSAINTGASLADAAEQAMPKVKYP